MGIGIDLQRVPWHLSAVRALGTLNPKSRFIQTKTQNTTNRNHVSIFISTCLHVTRLWLLIFHRPKSFSGSGRLLNFPGYQPYLRVWPSQIVARFWTLGQLCVSGQAHTTPWTRHDNYVPQDSSRSLRKLPIQIGIQDLPVQDGIQDLPIQDGLQNSSNLHGMLWSSVARVSHVTLRPSLRPF